MGLRKWLGLRRKRPSPIAPSLSRFEVSPDQIDPKEKTKTDIHRIFYENTGPASNKWHHYLDIYHRHLSRYRGSHARLLEIGIQNGGSIRLWREYLGPSATIFSIDIDPACARFDGIHGHVRIGSQADDEFLDHVTAEMGGLDIVIDDGGHFVSAQIASLRYLFPLLSEGGTYLCEDTHTSYWPYFGGGLHKNDTFIEAAKQIVDDLHADFSEEPRAFEFSRSISSIHFYNSIVVIEKAAGPRPMNVMVGETQLAP